LISWLFKKKTSVLCVITKDYRSKPKDPHDDFVVILFFLFVCLSVPTPIGNNYEIRRICLNSWLFFFFPIACLSVHPLYGNNYEIRQICLISWLFFSFPISCLSVPPLFGNNYEIRRICLISWFFLKLFLQTGKSCTNIVWFFVFHFQ